MNIKQFFFLAMITLVLTACNESPSSTSEEATDTSITPVVETEAAAEQTASKPSAGIPSYNVYIDSKYPPFAFKDDYGNPIGFDIDILNAIGEEAGFRPNFIGAEWEGIFDSLDNGKSDIVASGVSITDERKKVMDFTTPYLDTTVVIAYNSPSKKDYAALKSGTFGVQVGSSYFTQLIDEEGIDPNNINEYTTTFLSMQNLLSGKVDSVVDDKIIINYQIQSLADKTDISNIKIMALPGSANDPMAFAVAKGRTDLVNQINKGLETIRFNGEYDRIYTKWLGVTTPAE